MSRIFSLKKSRGRIEVPGTMFNFAVRITLPFSDVSGAVRSWAMKADKLLCYEHTNTDKLHCHLLMLNTSVDAERLKQLAKACGVDGKGNQFWSFKTKSKHTGPVSEETSGRYITYMTKGQFDPKYVKGYEQEYLLALKDAWTEHEEPVSREQELYDEFEGVVIDYCRAHPEVCAPNCYIIHWSKADVLVTLARRHAFAKAARIWNVRTASMAKSFFLTYCMREEIRIDEKKYAVW